MTWRNDFRKRNDFAMSEEGQNAEMRYMMASQHRRKVFDVLKAGGTLVEEKRTDKTECWLNDGQIERRVPLETVWCWRKFKWLSALVGDKQIHYDLTDAGRNLDTPATSIT